MPATFQPFGFSLFSYEGGKTSYTSRTFPLSSTGMAANIGFGDAVSLSAGNTAISGICPMNNPGNGFSLAYTDAWPIGVVESFLYTTPQGNVVNTTYWAANTPTMNGAAPIVTVNHLANSIFRIQLNGTLNAAAATGAYNANVNVVNNGGTGAYVAPAPTAATVQPNPATGQSSQFLINTPSGANNTTGQCKILGLAPLSTAFPVNSWTDLYPIVLVRINMHLLSAPTPSSY